MPKQIRWLVLVLILPIIGMLYSWAQHERREQSILLPDGTNLTFLSVTGGTMHEVSWGTNWERLVGWVPPAIRAYLPQDTNNAGLHTPTDTLCVWFFPQKTRRTFEVFAALSGDDGVEMVELITRSSPDPGKATFLSFPSDSQTLSIRFFQKPLNFHFDDPFQVLPVGEITFPNPLYGKKAPLQPSVPRIAQLDENSSLTLTSLTVNPSRKGQQPKPVTYAQALVEVGDPGQAWDIGRINAADRWGVKMLGAHHDPIAGNACFRFPSYPMPTEPWKLTFECIRKADFSPEDQVVFEGISMPEGEGVIPLNLSKSIRGSTVKLRSIHFAHGLDSGSIEVEVSPHPDDLYVSLVEPRGRPAKRDVRLPPMYRLHFNSFPIANGAKSFSLTLAVHLSQQAEIVAQPKLVSNSEEPTPP